MPVDLEERLRLARPNAGGPTLAATAVAREGALSVLPTRTRRPRIVAVGLTLAAAMAITGVELRSGAGTASAAQVRAAVSKTLATASNLSGVLAIDEPQADGTLKTQRWSFALDAAGDVRLKGLDTQDDLAVDAASGTIRLSQGGWFSIITDVAPTTSAVGPDWMLEREVGSVITALAADRDAHVQEIDYNGRPAWLLTIRAQLEGGAGTLEREITVDRSLGLPVHDVVRNDDHVVGEWRLENLAVDKHLPGGAFVLEPRPDQRTRSASEDSRRVNPDAIEALAGYAPLVPSWLPDGYRFDHAVVSRTYTTGGEPAGTNLVTFVYRRGLEELTVAMRPPGLGPPFPQLFIGRFCTTRSVSAIVCANTGGPQTLQTHEVTLAHGALAGDAATVAIDISVPPTLTAETPKLDVQISGDADEADLTRIAESLLR